MSVAEFIDTDISHLIKDIDELIDRFSVKTERNCKHCQQKHHVVSVDCGTPIFWYDGEKPIIDGERTLPPEGAIHWNEWVRRVDANS